MNGETTLGEQHRIDSPHYSQIPSPLRPNSTDRLAYILTTLGDLELEHSRRLTQGRTELKRIQVAELELASDRAQRIKIVKELQGLAAERQKPGGTARIDELQAQLTTLEAEAKAREEGLSKLKRQCFQQAFDKQMDSYIEAGEKLALLASYGKLLLREVPVNEPATFPAPKHQIGKGWEGSAKTARIRSLLQPALHSYVSKTTLPTLGDEPAVPSPAQTTSATVSDAASFRTSHAHELAEDERANPGEATVAVTGHPALSSCSEAHNSIPLAQLPEGGSPNPKWNHSPSLIPAVAARPAYEHTCSPPSGSLPQPSQLQQSRLQGRSAYPSAFAGSGHPEEQAVIEETAPPGPTVAETGAVLASSPQGPGPKTGVLERRRPSSNASGAEKPVLPPRPQAAVGTSTSSGPIGNTSPAFLPPSSAATQIHARIRRDGTITRRGVDHDFAQAEAEQLPAYAEVANDSAGAGNCAGTI